MLCVLSVICLFTAKKKKRKKDKRNTLSDANYIIFVFVCFVLRHINLIGHLMPNQVKENKFEKKFKKVLRINDKL